MDSNVGEYCRCQVANEVQMPAWTLHRLSMTTLMLPNSEDGAAVDNGPTNCYPWTATGVI